MTTADKYRKLFPKKPSAADEIKVKSYLIPTPAFVARSNQFRYLNRLLSAIFLSRKAHPNRYHPIRYERPNANPKIQDQNINTAVVGYQYLKLFFA